jgi:hypothetical protein
MSSRMKILGLVFALFAIQAIAASAAQASQYTASSYPASAAGSNTSGSETFTTPGGTVQCNTNWTVHASFGVGSIFGTAHWTSCKAFGFLNATVSLQGCSFQSNAGAAKGGGVYDNSVSVVCPAGKTITITAGTCLVDVPAQTGLKNVKTTNLAGGTVTVQPNVTPITMNVTTDGFGCPLPGTGHTTGTYHGDVVLSRVGGGTISVSGA